MIRFNILALAGAILATSVSFVAVSPVAAASVLQVRTDDLDLASQDGRSMLDSRITSAAWTVCAATDERDLTQLNACRHVAIDAAHKAVAAQRPMLALR